MMVRIECTSCGHVGIVHAETLVALRHDLSTLRRGSKRIASVAQLVSRYHTFSTGRDSRRRCAGRCSTAMRPVTRVVRAGGHVAERRDHFLLADNAGIRECRCVSLAVCTKRLLRLLRCHGRRRKKQCDGQHKYLHNGLHSLVRHQCNGRSWRRSLSAPTRHPWSEQRAGAWPPTDCQLGRR